jgi:5-methylcytosine-specific restriction enzyme subunit McrC
MTRVDLCEGGWKEYELTHEQAGRLTSSGLVQVKLGDRGGLWLVRDNGMVGAARLGDVELRIAPKITIPRLFFLLGYAERRIFWRDEELDAGAHPDLLPAVAHAFARQADRALRQGVLLGYREIEESGSVIRGRIREADQIRRWYGMPLPIEIRYDDFTVDIAENRLLLAAVRRLLQLQGVAPPTRADLRRLLLRLDGVEPLTPGVPLPEWSPSRLNARYHSALRLARLVLRGGSYELDDGTNVRVDGLMLEMWRVFEDFVGTALGDALRSHGGHCRIQDNSRYLDRGQLIQLLPDLVYYRLGADGDESPAAVIDAKYKVDKAKGGHNPDFYQMLAYCTRLGLGRGHLVYAKGEVEPRVHRVAGGSDVEIVQTTLDLTLQPAALLKQVSDLAGQIVGVAAGARR